jgi:hypothetical protein
LPQQPNLIPPGTGLPSQAVSCALALSIVIVANATTAISTPNPSEPLATHHVPRDPPVFMG